MNENQDSPQTAPRDTGNSAPEDDPGAPDSSPAKADSISILSKEGYRELKRGHLAEAEEKFLQILEREPRNSYALVGMGDTLRKKKQYRKAIPYYRSCLEDHPDNNYALFGLADSYKAQNLYPKAIDIWEDYLRLDPNNVTVLTRIADAYRKVKNFDRSLELYSRVMDLERGNAYALIGLGHLHYDFHHYRKALEYWQEMEVQRQDVDIRVLTSIGNCYRKLKQFEQGIPYFERALAKDENNFFALFGLADCYRGLGRPSQSLTCWNRILQFDPGNKVILTRAGDAHRNMGEMEKAEEYYRKALNIDFDYYAILGLALIHKSQGEYSEAVTAMSGLKNAEPGNPRIYTEIADCLVRMRDKAQALEVLQEFIRKGYSHRSVTDMIDRLRNPR